jgi:hypothetical protein
MITEGCMTHKPLVQLKIPKVPQKQLPVCTPETLPPDSLVLQQPARRLFNMKIRTRHSFP